MYADKDRAKILVVDDEATNIDVLVGLLGPHFKTVVAKSGEQALARLEHPPLPDLILLDVMMPGMDGYEVCRLIKENPATRDIPIIFITGKNEVEDEARGFLAGAVDYITKPFNPVIGMARVNTHLELKRRGDMLERLAGVDGLTGIPNRRRFDEVLLGEWKYCTRYQDPLSMLLADIDHFKNYNDRYGHAGGDEALRRIAGAIARAVPRNEDLAARYGGEEFACILPRTTLDGALAVAERMQDQVAALEIAHADSAAADHVTISIGVATTVPSKEDLPTRLVEHADEALYQAKRSGRNRIKVYREG